MIQLLSDREAEFLIGLKALILKYNVEFHCQSESNIRITIDAHMNEELKNPIEFSNYMDENDINVLLEETLTHIEHSYEKYNTNIHQQIKEALSSNL